MRQIRFLLTCLLILMLAGCEDTLTETSQTGSLEIALEATDSHNPCMKSGEIAVPDVSGFTVEIFDPEGRRIYRDSYSNTLGKTIALNAGKSYKLLVYHGNSLGIGWDVPYFEARTSFCISANKVREVKATAKMANVKVAVVFGENLLRDYTDVYCIARSGRTDVKGELRFVPEKNDAGYMPAGDAVLELYATVDGKKKFFRFAPQECKPNDFVTFKVDSSPREGHMDVEITIDDSVEEIVVEETVPESVLPQEAPAVTPRGKFVAGETGKYEFGFVEAEDNPGTQIDFVAMAGIKSVELDFPDYASLGLPQQKIDLVKVAGDKELSGRLEAFGLDWVREMDGARIGFIDFSNIGKAHSYDPTAVLNVPFTLTVTDQRGKFSEPMGFVLKQIPASFTVNAHEWNAFAKRIVGITADVAAGNPALVSLQYAAGAEGPWTDVSRASVSGNSVSYEDIAGLASGTPYYIRALYNGNELSATEPVMLTTEQELQVGNAGFEEWHTEEYSFKITWGGTGKRKWYLPWNDGSTDNWWAVNSKKTMRSECTVSNLSFKVFPTVTYSASAHNGNSAQLATIGTGAWGSTIGGVQTVAAGEIWIGTATSGGDHATDGHVFESRPSGMSFWYQYSPINNENFSVYIELKDKNGATIFSNTITDGPQSNEWKLMTIPFVYETKTAKAERIYMSFKSSSSSSPAYNYNVGIELPEGRENSHVGSVLKVDDIQLIYE